LPVVSRKDINAQALAYMAHDVFISHSSQDKPVADAVCAALETGSIRCWIAPRDVQPGRSFAGEITRAIQHSKVIALIFSAHSNNSEQVLREVQLAVDCHLHIVNFRIEDVRLNDDLKYYLSTPHWFTALPPPLENHLRRLKMSIKALLDAPAEESTRSAETQTLPAGESSKKALAQENRGRPDALARLWTIPNKFLSHVQIGTKLKLDPVDGSVDAPAIHLVARNEFKLGRSRQDADFLTWFWPRSPENDDKTRRLSKVHTVAEAYGDKLILRDAGSANRASFEGHSLWERENILIDQRGTLILGHEYHLDVTPFESTLEGPLEIANERLWSGPPPRVSSARGCVRFMPINTKIAQHNALWIFSDANFGCSKMNPLVLALPGMGEVEGRFHYYRQNFWIESRADRTTVFVDEHRLVEREIVPLINGSCVRIGDTTFNATVEA
jgi:hypothetical protein